MQPVIDMHGAQAARPRRRVMRERMQQHARIRAAAVADDQRAGRKRGEGTMEMVGNGGVRHIVITPETGRICNANSRFGRWAELGF